MTIRTRYLVSTIGMLAAAVVYVVLQGAVSRPGRGLERPVPGASQPAPPVSLPTARALLERRAELSLGAGQVSRLEALDRRWREETASLRVSVDAAQEELASFLATQAGQRTPLAEVERRSAEYRAASAELRAQRRRHAGASVAVLTESQRRALGPAPTGSNGERR